MAIGVSMDWDGLHGTLTRIAAIGREPGPLLAAIGIGLEDNTRDRFRDGQDPDGVAWSSYAPLNPKYAETKEGPGILRGPDLRLMQSIRSGVEGHSVVVGSDLVYAPVHQFGAVIVPKNAKALVFMLGDHKVEVGSVTIPARPYLGLSHGDREMAVDELEAFFGRATGRG
jgi:phage virion morphogenesis protein